MTDLVLPAPPSASVLAWRIRRLAARLGASALRALKASMTRRALSRLPDTVLHDLGLTRGQIPSVAEAVACGRAELRHAAAPTKV
jgi:uncharacterized protein YjiS (DUF1127 family)